MGKGARFKLLENKLPICVYNTHVPELIAIFRSATVLSKYLSVEGRAFYKTRTYIGECLAKKTGMLGKSNSLGLRLAFRYMQEDKAHILGELEYILLVDYIPKLPFNYLKGFHSTAHSFHIEMGEISKIAHPNIKKPIKGKL